VAERTVAVNLIMRVAGTKAALGTVVASAKDARTELEQLRVKGSAGFQSIQTGALAAGTALAALAGWAVKSAMEFDKQMSAVQAVSLASASDMDKLRKAALAAGETSIFSATQAAEAETELARAGIGTADILGGALKGSLALAAAGQIDLAEAATVTTQAMTIFGLKASDAGHIADVLAAGANKSVTDVHDLALGMRMAGTGAALFGMTLEETVGALSLFAQNALRGSDGGTSLKQMLIQIASPSKIAAAEMQQLGLKFYDAQGKFIGLAKLAELLRDKLGGLTDQQRQKTLADVFGSDAMRAANILYQTGAKGVDEWTAAVDDAGAAQRTASAMTDNLAGDLKKLRGQLNALFIESGEGSTGGLRLITEALGHLVGTFNDLPGPVKTAAILLAGISGAVLLLAVGWLKAGKTMAATVEAMRAAGPVIGKAATALEFASKWAGRAAIAFGLLEVASSALDMLDRNTVNLDALTTSLKEFSATGKVSGEMAAHFGGDMSKFTTDIAIATSGARGFVGVMEGMPLGIGSLQKALDKWKSGDSLKDANENIKTLDDQLTALVKSGDLAAARGGFARLLQMSGVSATELIKLFPQYSAAITEAEKHTVDLAGATNDAQRAGKLMADTLDDEIDKGMKLIDVWQGMHGEMATTDSKMLDAKKAIAALGDTFAKNKEQVKGNTIAALENRTALEAAAEKAADSASAYLDQTGDVAGAAAMMKQYEADAVAATKATGKNKEAVKALADQLFQLPASKTVTIQLKFQGVIAEVKSAIQGVINAIPKSATKHAAGGWDAPGWNQYGEQGPELHWSPGGGAAGYTVPAAQSARIMSGGGGTRPVVNVTVHVDPVDGRVRKVLIQDAEGRGIPAGQIRVAHP